MRDGCARIAQRFTMMRLGSRTLPGLSRASAVLALVEIDGSCPATAPAAPP